MAMNDSHLEQQHIVEHYCIWKRDNYEMYYYTSCNHYFTFTPDGKRERDFKWCPYCSGKIRAKPKAAPKNTAPNKRLYGQHDKRVTANRP